MTYFLSIKHITHSHPNSPRINYLISVASIIENKNKKKIDIPGHFCLRKQLLTILIEDFLSWVFVWVLSESNSSQDISWNYRRSCTHKPRQQYRPFPHGKWHGSNQLGLRPMNRSIKFRLQIRADSSNAQPTGRTLHIGEHETRKLDTFTASPLACTKPQNQAHAHQVQTPKP